MDIPNQQQVTPLHCAATARDPTRDVQQGPDACLEFILTATANNANNTENEKNNMNDDDSASPNKSFDTSNATSSSNQQEIDEKIKSMLNAVDKFNRTPLSFACAQDSKTRVETLLDYRMVLKKWDETGLNAEIAEMAEIT